jgi:hypothetical protein
MVASRRCAWASGRAWAEADEGGEQRHGTDGSEPGVIDDAVGDEAEAEDDAQGAIDGSDVGFHMAPIRCDWMPFRAD